MPQPPEKARSGKPKTREDKLAAALRENLRRRKAQARAKAAAAPEPGESNADDGRKGAEKPI